MAVISISKNDFYYLVGSTIDFQTGNFEPVAELYTECEENDAITKEGMLIDLWPSAIVITEDSSEYECLAADMLHNGFAITDSAPDVLFDGKNEQHLQRANNGKQYAAATYAALKIAS